IDNETAILNANDDIEVSDSVIFDNAGILQLPNTGTCVLTIGKSIDMSGSSAANTLEVITGGTAGTAHSIIVGEDIIMNNNADINLYTGTTKKANLYFTGNENSTITASTGNIDLNYLYIDKTLGTDEVHIQSNISLTDNTDRPITLTKGHLILDNTSDISLTSGDGDFTIPSDSKLSIDSSSVARITGSGADLILYGALSVEDNGQMLINDAANNNHIEYGSSGSSISVSGTATLTVGSQIRRKTTTESGFLSYNQSGGTVTVGNSSANETSRGVFEILNTGSDFTFTGGDLIIARGQTTTEAALYLDPATSSLAADAKITFGNANTPATQTIGIYSSIELENIEISTNGAVKTVKVYSLPLTIDSLLVNTGQTFDANSNNIVLNGNLRNDGTYTTGSNTTSFIGSQQKIVGIGTYTFDNLTIQTADSVRLYNDITITGDLDIASGRFSDRTNTINLEGNFNNDGYQFSKSLTVGGVVFNGAIRQEVTGSGTFGLLNVDNPLGVDLRNDFTVVDRNITLTIGSLFIRQYQLELGSDANIVVPAGTFNKDRMIITNGAVSDKGVKRAIAAGTPSDVLIPVGVIGKYTPVEISNINNTGGGYVLVRPVNQDHPTALDPDNVLQYYWNLETSVFTAFNADIDFYYEQTDVSVTGVNLESDYIPAYLYDASWSKFGTENVNSLSNIIEYNFNTGANLDGDFTAGIPAAIPDDVPVFYTISDGTWETPGIWEREDAAPVTSFPSGFIVKIRHDVTMSDLKSAYKTIIEQGGELIVGTSIGHYFGNVSGVGHLSIETGRLPAGNYDDFFDCTGGTMEFGGVANYEIPDEGLTYRRLIFSGTGEKILSSRDITVCDTLLITSDAIVDNETHNNQITLNGLFELQTGTFKSGSVLNPNATVIFNGSSAQNIIGDFTGASKLNNFTMNNSAGLTLGGNISVANVMTLTSGNITTGTDTLTLEIAATVSPAGGSSSSFIDGALFKVLADGDPFTFPTGNGTRYGKFDLIATNTGGAEKTWESQYYDSNPITNPVPLDPASFDGGGGLQLISEYEYWRANGEASTDSRTQIRWDANSILPAMTADRAGNLKMVEWSTGNSRWEEVTPATVTDGGINSGTISSDNNLTLDGDHYFTLGTTEGTPLPAAGFLTLDTAVCDGSTITLRVQVTGNPEYSVTVDDGSGTTVYSNATSPITFDVTPGATTTYTITQVTEDTDASSGGPLSSTTTIFGSPVVVTVIPLPTPSIVPGQVLQTFCAGETTNYSVTNNAGNTYNWVINGGNILAGQGTNAVSVEWLTDPGDITITETTPETCQGTDNIDPVTINPIPTANDQTPADLCSEVGGENAQVTGVDLTALQPAINGGGGITYTWYEDAALTTLVTVANPDLTDVTINVTINGGALFETEDFYCVVSNGTCTDVATVTYTIYRTPETGPQYHIEDTWSN
ncbi:beta strand repeat-containing protein, partial [Bacteroidota bacterium]